MRQSFGDQAADVAVADGVDAPAAVGVRLDEAAEAELAQVLGYSWARDARLMVEASLSVTMTLK